MSRRLIELLAVLGVATAAIVVTSVTVAAQPSPLANSQQAALAQLPPHASAREQMRALVRHHFEVLLQGPKADFIPVMLYEWRSLNADQRKDIAAIKDAYEGAWMPVLQALHEAGALRADPAMARLFIFGALNWSVQWFSVRGALSIDGLTDQALALFIGEA